MAASFSCRIKSQLLNQLLTCFGGGNKKDSLCTLEASASGLTLLLVNPSKSTQSQLNMPSSVFDQYVTKGGEGIRILTDLYLLSECSKFISNPEIAMTTLTYSSEKAAVILTLEESNTVTVCEVSCIDDEEAVEAGESILEAFRRSSEMCQVIVKSELLGESVEEMIGTVGLSTVLFEAAPNYLKIETIGSGGSSDIVLSRHLSGVISFRCDAIARHCYLVTSFLAGIKALSTSREVCFRLNEEGVMYIQHQIVAAGGEAAFLNFVMLPLESE